MIEAVVVNHNTSEFAELCLRSLRARTRGLGSSLHVTVADNHSTDDGARALRRAATECDATWWTTRWPAVEARVNTHGDVLRDFVLDRPEADFYLFLDADVVFIHDDTLTTMKEELDADAACWAVQARFANTERTRGSGASLDIGAGTPQHLYCGFEDPATQWSTTFPIIGTGQARCHPACLLIKNSSPLQRMAGRLGFATWTSMSADTSIAGYYDTMALASAVMSTLGYHYALSSAEVVHYFNVSYDERTSLTEAKRDDVHKRLDVLRSDPTARTQPGPWG